MKSKKWLFVCVPIAVILVLALALYLGIQVWFFNPKINVAIQDDGTYYNMTARQLLKIKGEPIDMIEDDITPYNDYYFKETVCGYEADSCYAFYRSLLGQRLTSVHVTISCDSADAAKNVFNRMYTQMDAYYKTQVNYYNSGTKTTEESELTVSFGTNDGGAGVPNDISLSGTKVTISTFDLY